MISPAAAKDAFRQSAIRFLACLAALSVAGLALVITHPAWWPVSVVTAASVPLLYHLAGLGRMRQSAPIGTFRVMESLARAGYTIWHDMPLENRRVSHVVIGSGGVFAISSVTWGGRFHVTDGELGHSRKRAEGLVWEANRSSAAVRARLRSVGLRRVPVRTVITSTRSAVPQGPIDLGQAILMRTADLSGYILSECPSLSPEQVARAITAFEGEEPTERSRPGRG